MRLTLRRSTVDHPVGLVPHTQQGELRSVSAFSRRELTRWCLKIWSYPSTSVIGPTLFQIPLEEVFFFVIQTYITSCIYAVVSRPVIHAVLLPRSGREGRRAKWIGTSAFLTITAASVVQLQKGGEGTYLALILVWASPFLALLW